MSVIIDGTLGVTAPGRINIGVTNLGPIGNVKITFNLHFIN